MKQQERERGRKSCLGLLLAEYVRKTKQNGNHTTAGSASGGNIELLKEVTVGEPTCLGFSWKTPPEQAESKLSTLDKLDVVTEEEGIPLRLKYMCYGVCRHNASKQSGDPSKVELPQCGGMEILIQSVVADRREKSATEPLSSSSTGRMGQERAVGGRTGTATATPLTSGIKRDHQKQSGINGGGSNKEDIRMKELRTFCTNFMTVSGRIAKKMGENGGLVVGVCEKTLREANEGIRKAFFGEDKK